MLAGRGHRLASMNVILVFYSLNLYKYLKYSVRPGLADNRSRDIGDWL